MNVLLVAPWVPASLVFARSLRRHGLSTFLLQVPSHTYCAPRTFSALEGCALLPRELVSTPQGLQQVREYARHVGAAAIVALTDPELLWLASHRRAFEPQCRVLVQSADSLAQTLSKRHQIALARDAGLSVLPTHLLETPDDVDAVPDSDFPVAVRPDSADAVQPAFKIDLARTRVELQDLVRRCDRIAAPLLAQPFLPLPTLIVHGACADSGALIALRGFRAPRKFEGVALAVEPCDLAEELLAQCEAFVSRAGIRGCFHIEFLASPDGHQPHFLEVNVRLGGTTDKVAHYGYDEPALLLECYGLLSRRTIAPARPPRRVVNKRVVLKHLVSAARGRLTAFDYPEADRLSQVAHSCRDLIVATDSVFDWRDVSGSVRFHLRDVLTRLG